MKWARGLTSLAALAAVSAPVVVAAQAQIGRITGTVTVAGGQPLVGANVLVVGTEIRGSTGPDGRFSLPRVPVGTRQVRIQRIGYAPIVRTVVVTANAAVTVDAAMEAQALVLTEIVSVGYGTQSRRDVAGSVASVSTAATENAPIATVDQLLQGTAPGVQVTTASSEPGGAISIRVRGASSITGSGEPLYVIDGFPIENDIEGSAAGNGGRSRTTPPNPLVTLNPSDIESISILKDAASTAIYGARGANGVVIITTKQGKGVKPQFSLDTYGGAQSVARRYDLLDAAGYMDYANAFGANQAQPFTPFPDSVKTRILAQGIDTDWQDAVFRGGGVRNLQLGVRGATSSASVTRYNLSGGYFDTDGIVSNSGLRRLSARLNLDQAIGSRFQFAGSFSASQARSRAVPTAGQQNANAGAVSAALQYVPVLPVRRADGTYTLINPDLNTFASQLDAPQTPNPVSLTQEVRDSLSDTRLLGNVFAQATLMEGLTAKILVGADYADRWRNTYYPRATLRGLQNNGEAIRATSITSSWLNENTLNFQRKLGRIHDVNLLGGYTRQGTNVDGANMTNTNFANDITGYFNIGAGAREGGPSVSSRRTQQTLESWLARANYTLLDRYLLTFAFRADGSSRFASNRKWGSFPSAALGWRLSDESFLRDLRALDELKLRVSYGIAGNPSIRPYQSLARLANQGISFGGSPFVGYYPTAVGNPDLTWETTSQANYGVDLGLWNRVGLTADYYTKKTTDLLLEIQLPLETGFESALANRGAVTNRGLELGLDVRLFEPGQRRGGFAWRTNLNYATNRNRVVDLGGPERLFAELITTDFNLPGTMIQKGQPIGVFFGFKSEGIIRDSASAAAITTRNFNGGAFRAGDMKVTDVDGDGTITLNDRTIIGDPTPRFTLGLTNTFAWKGVELTGLLQGSFGGKILNVNRLRTESSPRVNVARDRWLDAWSPTNTDGRFPRIGENPNQVGTNNFTDNLLEDGSFVRLRTLTVSYVIPRGLLRRANATGARVYLTGTNLWTGTDYSGFDPDVSGQSVANTNRGIDIGAYPLAKAVTFGLSLNY